MLITFGQVGNDAGFKISARCSKIVAVKKIESLSLYEGFERFGSIVADACGGLNIRFRNAYQHPARGRELEGIAEDLLYRSIWECYVVSAFALEVLGTFYY